MKDKGGKVQLQRALQRWKSAVKKYDCHGVGSSEATVTFIATSHHNKETFFWKEPTFFGRN